MGDDHAVKSQHVEIRHPGSELDYNDVTSCLLDLPA
jgi:hypothetical protein